MTGHVSHFPQCLVLWEGEASFTFVRTTRAARCAGIGAKRALVFLQPLKNTAGGVEPLRGSTYGFCPPSRGSLDQRFRGG
jgi:hypothetical protein